MPKTPGYSHTVVCPYNKTHLILAERMQTHLIKCKKSFPEIILKKCLFNVTHLVPESEFESHLLICVDRASFDLFKFKIESGRKVEQELLEPPPLVVCEANWDDEEHPTYDPQTYVENANVIRTLNVATPSEKKSFREAEKLRLRELNNKKY